MQEVFEKIIEKLEENQTIEMFFNGKKSKQCVDFAKAIENVNQVAAEYNNGWIPCNKELPPQPEENPVFDNKPLELYLASVKGADYPFRVFWNGKFFTDGFGKVDVIAWQPLPKPYQPKGE